MDKAPHEIGGFSDFVEEADGFADDDSKFVSVMAPCSISVYEKSDGRTYLAAIDMALMSKLMGGDVGPVLAEIAAEDAAIIGFASVDR